MALTPDNTSSTPPNQPLTIHDTPAPTFNSNLNFNPPSVPTGEDTRSKSYRFPPDIGNLAADNDFPYIIFTFIEYQQPRYLRDNDEASSTMKLGDYKGAYVGNPFAFITLPLPADFTNAIMPIWSVQETVGSGVIADATAIVVPAPGVGRADEAIKTAAAAVGIGLHSIGFQRWRGQTLNPKKQAFFGGIDTREFTFSWTFSPKSKDEAVMLENIIREFTIQSLPDIHDFTTTWFDLPSECKIRIGNVAGFPIFQDPLVVTSVQTNYSPATMQFLESGHTVQIGLTITVKETAIRTQSSPGV